jgi:phosphoribosylaminoimidazolecarboxamide formyltransferase/IMP cyclohydrolase
VTEPVDRVTVRRALLSVYDKTGLAELAEGLHRLGVELWSSGGTAAALGAAGIPVVEVGDVTGAPEMLGGRVKTLHPRVHGGILADRSDPAHVADMEREGYGYIDLVVVNLYPFLVQPGIETIDIGGPTMIRAAAKNHAHVAVVTDPAAYPGVLGELQFNRCTLGIKTRRALALDAFAHTAAFDAAVVRWLQDPDAEAGDATTAAAAGTATDVGAGTDAGAATDAAGAEAAADSESAPLPRYLPLVCERAAVLRYGENPHQRAARYRDGSGGFHEAAVQHGGKELSFINLLDVDAAYRTVWAFPDTTACVIVKHANPCGVAVGADALDAYQRAFECDSLSAFGGVVAVNRPLSVEAAAAIAGVFTEVVVAPAYEPGAIEALTAKKNLRVLEAPRPGAASRALDFARIDGGFLVQDADTTIVDRSAWRVVTKVHPTEEQWADLEFAYVVCAHVTSNTIVLARAGQAVGIGAGQQSRVHSAEIAARKAGDRARGGACASDAFFPFRDGLDAAAEAGVAAVIQPGGSVRDDEVVAAADEHGIAMVLTGRRHFRH